MVLEILDLFTEATLKGGLVTPEEIVDAYINANRALYETNRRMFLDIEAAKTLGMSEDAIAENMDNRGERQTFDSLNEGEFRPLTISRDVEELFETRARELGVPNPFEQAADVIDRIREVLSKYFFRGDLFPDIKTLLELYQNLLRSAAHHLAYHPAKANSRLLVNNATFGNIDSI